MGEGETKGVGLGEGLAEGETKGVGLGEGAFRNDANGGKIGFDSVEPGSDSIFQALPPIIARASAVDNA